MQYLIRHTPGWPALTIAVAVASALLLAVFSARAAAEDVDVVGAASSAAAAPAQAIPPPAPEAVASEPVEATEPDAVVEIPQAATESEPPEPPATPSGASSAAATHASSTRLPPTPDLPAPDARGVSNAVKDVPSAVKDLPGVPSTDQAQDLIQTADRAPAKAAAAIAGSAKSTVEAVDRVAPVDRVAGLARHPLQTASGALQMVRGALLSGVRALTVPEAVEKPGWSSGVPLEVDADAFSSPLAPAVPGTVASGFRRHKPAAGLDRSSIQNLLDLSAVGPLPSGVPGVSTGSSLGRPELGHISTTPGNERSADFTPLDGLLPQPAPGSSPNVAGGSGSTTFIPIVALFALLALAASAICRRPGEGPALRPQTPFVCALERPG